MPGLLDIGPLTEDVSVGKQKVTVYGLTADDIFYLIANFVEIKALLEKKLATLDPQTLMDNAPTTIASIIACSTHERGNQEAIAKAAGLPVGHQLQLLNAMFRLTFPQGAGPFVKELEELQVSFSGPTEGSATVSPSTVSASLQMDKASEMRYRPRRVN